MEEKHILKPRSDGESLKIAEGVLRRRRVPDNDRRLRIREERRRIKKDLRKPEIKTLQKILKKSRNKILDQRRLQSKDKKPYLTPKKSNGRLILLVVRNSRFCGSPSSSRKLHSLGLVSRFSAVVLSHSDETIRILREVKPYVFYGFPTMGLLKALVFKKGAFRSSDAKPGSNAEQKRILLTDNNIVEERLGDVGVLCTEDIVTGLWNGCETDQDKQVFEMISKNLAPFQLCDLKRAEGLDARKFESGFLGKKINDKINQVI
ncbi:L30 RNA binding domain-containing 60S ribosomal [Cryptosporidium canis]|uniref:L30 RNA binding domain-containing 60S ribosomal n=1 Tax=Cryptosporidium canis TaxID=195482 RepID=A0ABQ8PD11_9CRYT|nr:L30 RNA binding domain-containing 60S ribosomal [Cryptosporidium canis]KAJ1614873.1 L30 RNA binding domain-containing 60S ribosomal [Cryptosporidium canis]